MLKTLNYKRIIGFIICVILVAFVGYFIVTDLFYKISTDAQIELYNDDGQLLEIQPNDNKTFEITNHKCPFDKLEIYFAKDDNGPVSISIIDSQNESVIGNFDFDNVEESSNGNKVASLSFDEVVDKGTYKVIVENKGNAPLNVCTKGEELNVSIIKSTKVGYYIAIFVIAILVVYLGLTIFLTRKSKSFNIEKFFLISVICLGACYFVLFTPWNTADIGAHYQATYRFSNILLGQSPDQYWLGRAEDVNFFFIDNQVFLGVSPTSIKDYAEYLYNFTFLCNDTTLLDFPYHEVRMEYYSIFCYWPQILGITLGRLFGVSAILAAYFAKLLMFGFYVWGCYNAVKNAPIGKGVFAFVSLLPLPLLYSSAISYDSLVFVVTLNFIAGIFALYHDSSSKKMLIQVIVWAFMLGATKGGGYLILLPITLILFNKNKIKESCINCFSILGSGIISVILFDKVLQIGKILFQFQSQAENHLETSYALGHPLKYLQMVMTTYFQNADELVFGTLGALRDFQQNYIPHFVVGVLFVIIIFYGITEKDKCAFDNKSRYIFLITIIIALISTPAMLLRETKMGDEIINGLQGRYFLPVLSVVVFLMTKFSLHNKCFNAIDNDKAYYLGKKCIVCFCIFSCVAIYYLMRVFLRG